MIDKKIQEYFLNGRYSIVNPIKNISMVFEDNNLSHAILILKDSNFKQIPVLNYDKKFIGLISIHHIHQSLGDDFYNEFDSFMKYKIKDFIDTHYAVVEEDFELEDVLNLLVDYNFVNVIDSNGKYIGMITRSTIFKKMNALLHSNSILFKEDWWAY